MGIKTKIQTGQGRSKDQLEINEKISFFSLTLLLMSVASIVAMKFITTL